MRYTTVLFDLDGTLVNSAEGITKSVAYALSCFGIQADERGLTCFIGPPLIDSFMRFYGFSKEQAGEAVDFYRARYRTKGVYENTVYPGIGEALAALKREGVCTAVATSKPEVFANVVVDDMGLRPFLDGVFGAELDDKQLRRSGFRSEKADVIEYALDRLCVCDRSKVLMVGDRKHDIIGAKACGIDSCGVLWGFGDREELTAAGADYIAAAPADIEVTIG